MCHAELSVILCITTVSSAEHGIKSVIIVDGGYIKK